MKIETTPLTGLLLSAFLFAPASDARAADYQIVTDEHVDVQVAFSGGIWGSFIRPDSGDVERDQGLLYEDDAAFISPGGSQWEFLGVGAGDPIYILPQTQYDGRLYLGFGSDDGSIPLGVFASYFENDPRVNNTAAWTKISLLGMRFFPDPTDTATHAPEFSLWATAGALGGPESGVSIWMATSDGIDSTDATWLYAGGHSHYNWGFSRKGYYQLDFQYSGYLNDGQMTFTESPVFTFHFGIEYLPQTIPEPNTATLLAAAAASFAWRRRPRRSTANEA